MAGGVRFTTLGPAGTNHEMVAAAYIAFHGLERFDLSLCETVAAGVEAVRSGDKDFMILCSVHPDTPRAVGSHFQSVFIVDSFISPSQPLAVMTRQDVAEPQSIGVLHPATSDYVDTSRWARVDHITTGTLHDVAAGLLAGRFDSGLVYLKLSEQHPGRLRVDQVIGSPDDAWLVLGRERSFTPPVLAWRESPAARQFARIVQERAYPMPA